MSAFTRELRVIPRAGWWIAGIVYAALLATFIIVLRGEREPAIIALAGVIGPLMLAAVVLLIGYINGDAKRRGMNSTLWTFLAFIVPNAIGIILYFILREPLLRPCPSCGALARPRFAYCPKCGASLAPACPQCRRAVEAGWRACPYCGASLAMQPTA